MGRVSASLKPGHVLAIVCAGIVLANLDLFIVNVALPTIAVDFHDSNLGSLSWILNSYAIVYAALLIFWGRLTERYPRNLSFLCGLALFTLGSAACAFAGGLGALIACRVLQAAGAALVTPTSLGLILATFPPERRAGAVRQWAAIGGFAAAAGPLIGGLLLNFNWRWIFLVNVPIGLVALVAGAIWLPRIPGHPGKAPSLFAAALITGGIGLLVFAIVKIDDWGWRSPSVGLSLAGAAALLALFCAHCLYSRNPFVEPALFRAPNFTRASLTMALFSAAFGGFLLSMVLWEQGVWGWSAMKVGVAIAPGPFMVPVTALLVGGRAIARFGSVAVTAIGLLLFSASAIVWATLAGPNPNLGFAVLAILPSGVGVGLVFPTLMGMATSGLPASSLATGSGAINMIRQTGLAVGVAAFVATLGFAGPADRMAGFRTAWWLMAAITAVGLLPLMLQRRVAAIQPSE